MKFVLLACLPLLAGEKEVVALWPALPQGPAEVWVERSTTPGELDRAVSNIHNPTLTVYLPERGKATGAAMIIAAGGGHQRLAIDKEGFNVAKCFSDRGVAAFVLKYRLAREKDSKYTVDEHALGDGTRAIRMVRANAKKWGLDPEKIGIIGFSAGGEVAALAGTNFDAGDAASADPIARMSSRPSYMVLTTMSCRRRSRRIFT
jgi:endo-1,4-beta-xylanase